MRAANLHAANVQRFLLDPLPAGHRERFARDLRTVSLSPPGTRFPDFR